MRQRLAKLISMDIYNDGTKGRLNEKVSIENTTTRAEMNSFWLWSVVLTTWKSTRKHRREFLWQSIRNTVPSMVMPIGWSIFSMTKTISFVYSMVIDSLFSSPRFCRSSWKKRISSLMFRWVSSKQPMPMEVQPTISFRSWSVGRLLRESHWKRCSLRL